MSQKSRVEMQELKVPGFERVVEAVDSSCGLHCFIAIHSTVLGPGLGGIRCYPYASRDEGLRDVLRLAEGMTYKAAVGGFGTGGAKSVILGDVKKLSSPELWQSFGEVVNALEGRYIAAEDVNTTCEDMLELRKTTPYVVGLPPPLGSGDPSPYTARGVFEGLRAVCQTVFGSSDFVNRRVAIQGLGKVGSVLAEFLFWEGAELILSDVQSRVAKDLGYKYGARVVSPDEVHRVPCDLFVPAAMGGILGEKTIPELCCRAVAGAANNQLVTDEDSRRLYDLGIVYVPDFVINSGGLVAVSRDMSPEGFDARAALGGVHKLYDVVFSLLEKSQELRQDTQTVALEMAQQAIEKKIGLTQKSSRYQHG